MESLENLENHYDTFSTCKQVVKICKIFVKYPYPENFIIKHHAFDTFWILYTFHSKVFGKPNCF